MLSYLAAHQERFAFCEEVHFGEEAIRGKIRRSDEIVDEQTRLTTTNQMDVLRAVAFAFRLASKPFRVTCGLLGALSYDFVDQFETLPQNREDLLGNPDYELYFADNIFLMDHENDQGYVVVNVIVTDDEREAAIAEAQDASTITSTWPGSIHPSQGLHGPLPRPSTDTDQANTKHGADGQAAHHRR